MIISVSRRTDIPAFYSEWFVNRLNEGYCVTRNPMNAKQERRISLLPQDVSGFVFWTKNAAPMLPVLDGLSAYQWYFQYTITTYGTDIERGLPSKRDIVIPAFREISTRYGAERLVWRYDPILFTQKYTPEYHIRAFTRLCELLSESTRRCVISFVLPYKSIAASMRNAGIIVPEQDGRLRLAEALAKIAGEHGIELCACCEAPEIYALGVKPTACINATLLGLIDAPRDKNQRAGCNCAASVDLGAYNSCMNGCVYCYANHGDARVRRNFAEHDAAGEALLG